MNSIFKKIRKTIGSLEISFDSLLSIKRVTKFPLLVAYLICFIALLQVVNLTWSLIFPKIDVGEFIQSLPSSTDASGISYVNLKNDPFLSKESNVINKVLNIDAPPTALSLRLYGIRYSDSGSADAAILGFDPKNQRIYKTNDIISDDIVLEYIEPERIIISRGGIRESVTFNKDTVLSGSFKEILAINKGIKTEKSWLESNSLSKIISFQPYFSDGSIKGYQLFPVNDLGLFSQTGLEPGDLLVSVNGLSINDPTIIKELKGLGDVRLDLVRGNDDLSITVTLD